jgi:hypothetical protein
VFHGLGLVVIEGQRTPGRMTLRAEAEGLEPAEINLESSENPYTAVGRPL